MQKYSPIYHTIYCLVAFKVAFMTMQGTLQNYVKFADPLNEMFFCVGALMIGFLYLYAASTDIYEVIKGTKNK
jgi:hypothetical protein